MTEELNALRKADKNLRDALSMDEAERPRIPADLNERLMQRVVNEKKKPRRIIWPWIAAACVAGVMMVLLMPPKEQAPTVAQQTPSSALPMKEVVSPEVSKVEEPVVAKVETKKVSHRTPTIQAAKHTPHVAEPTTDLAAVQEKEVTVPSSKEQGGGSVVTLTERDIPITRPENLIDTPEELALLERQTNEAFLERVKLELEISKYNLEQASLN